jgi:integrase/recombinase XerD
MRDWQDNFTDEIELRNLDEKTKRGYIKSMELFLEFYQNRPPEDLDIRNIKEYQRYLINDRKLAPNSINRHMSGIRQFYRHVLGRYHYSDALPRVKAPRSMPVVLSESEVALMINSVHKVFYKAVLMVMYSAGLRNSEVRNLKTSDIDSKRMVINVRNGKGGKDRQALLSPLVLQCLRTYWRLCRLRSEVKSDWLFVGSKTNRGGKPKHQLSHTALGYIVTTAAYAAGIKKKYIPTSFAIPSLSIS